jgi:hypothetical protein
MEKIIVIAVLISSLFFLIKVLEMKFLTKEMVPLKQVIRDSVYVFVASFATLFVFLNMVHSIDDFMNVITGSKSDTLKATQVFTGEPGF